MLSPFGTLLPYDLQDHGRHILDTLQGFRWRSSAISPTVPCSLSSPRSARIVQPPRRSATRSRRSVTGCRSG